MRTSSWTKNEIAAAFADCATLRDVIVKMEESNVGEVICEIRVNDLLLNEEDEAKFAATAVADLDKIEIKTMRPTQLVTDALKSAAELVPQLEKSALTTAELIRAGEAARASKGFSETIGGCQWLVETLLHVRGASEGLGLAFADATQWVESEKMIGRVVGEVSEAHRRSDTVLVADLLEYEMTAALAMWKTTIAGELDRSPEP